MIKNMINATGELNQERLCMEVLCQLFTCDTSQSQICVDAW